jgi:beta-mannosidase
MFACSVYDFEDKDYLSLIDEETRVTLRRIRHHACLFLLSGNNEIEEQMLILQDVHREKYRKLFLEYLPKIVKEEIDIYYLTSSPTSGEPYMVKPSDNNYLDAHNWAVWHGLEPFEYFHTIFPRLLSEYGCQSIPTYDTVKKYAIEEDLDLESPVMNSHQKNCSCNYKILHYAKSLFREPTNFEDLVYLSQLTQAQGIKMCAEHLRRNKERCNGTLYWQLNDDWPGQSWSSIDYYFGIKALHYYSRRFYAPHLISLVQKENKILVAISNDTKENTNYIVHYSLYDFEGHLLDNKEVRCDVSKTNYKYALEVNDPFNKDDLVIYVELQDENGNLLSNNFYQKLKDMNLHYKLPNLKVTKIDDKSFYLETDYYTKDIYIEPHDNNCVLSDNYFNLLPNQKVVITSTNPLDYKKLKIRSLNEICK